MTNFTKIKTSAHSTAIPRSKNEGGELGRVRIDKAISWFVPPIVVPGLLFLLIIAQAAYVAYY
jgi:hypothetical protein